MHDWSAGTSAHLLRFRSHDHVPPAGEAVVRQRQEEEAKAAERRAAAAAAAQRAAAEQARAHAAARTTLADSHEVTAAQAAAAAAQPVRSQQQPNASPSPAPQPTSGAPGGSHPAGRPAVSASASQQPAGNSQAGGAQLTRAEALRQAREKQQALAAEVARLHAERVREMQAASRAMQAAAVAPPAGGSGVNAAAAAASAAAARAQDATGAAPQPAVPTPPSRPAAASPAAPAAPLGSGPFAAPPGSYEAERQRRVEADRLLRQQQDEEYEASLQRDRENSGTSRGSAAADSSRGDSMAVSGGAGALAVGPVGEPPSALTNEAGGDVDAAATAEAVQLLRRRREALQAEFALEAEPSVSEGHAQPPSDAPCAGGTSNGGVGGSCEVRVRLPDGSFATRRFTGGTAIGRVKAWVFSLERMPLWREEGFELATVVPRRQLAVGEALADVAAGCGRLLLFVEQTD